MYPINPVIDPSILPEGSMTCEIGEHQPEFITLPCVRTPGGVIITRWTLSAEERKRIAQGEDVYISILAEYVISPILPTVGKINWTVGIENPKRKS